MSRLPLRGPLLGAICLALSLGRAAFAQTAVPPTEFDPATEPAVRAVAQVLPAVVNIATERVIRQRVSDPFEDLFNQFFNDGRNANGGRVIQNKVSSLGSGFLVSPDGLIVTNEHVVERAADMKIQITFSDGTAFPARYVTGDRSKDLALIKIERVRGGAPFPFIDLNRLSPNLLGETVLVLGNPLGYTSSVARGILSATNRDITVQDTAYKGLLQTDAAINPGNSGGPLIDLAGRLVGVSSVKASFTPQGTPTQGLGFAIPGRTVAAWMTSARGALTAGAPPSGAPRVGAGEGVSRARQLFGVTLGQARSVNARGASAGEFVTIVEVERGSPAEEAGLRAGMVLNKLGTYSVTSPARVEAILADVPAGTAVDLVVGPGTGVGGRLDTITLLARGEPGA